MAEVGIPYDLVTSLGTLGFNVYADDSMLLLTDVTGLDSANVRSTKQSRPQRDGMILADSFNEGRYPILTGRIMWTTLDERYTWEQQLRAYARSILRADGTLRWVPTNQAPRILTVRMNDRLEITNDHTEKTFMLPLVAADPTVYSEQVHTASTAFLSAGGGGGLTFPMTFPIVFTYGGTNGNGTFTNVGDVDSYPRIRIYGPIQNPILINNTTDKFISFTSVTLNAGDYLDIDMLRETITRNGSPTYLLGAIDAALSTFWPLVPGANNISIAGSNADGVNTVATVTWQDAYA